MIEYGFAPLHEVLDEIAPNVDRHYSELIDDKEDGPLFVDWAAFIEGSHTGSYVVTTARSVGRLVGYSVYQITNDIRRKDIFEAYGEALFVEKEFRGAIGPRLLEESAAFLKKHGVHQLNHVIKSDRVGNFLRRSGYEPTFQIWSKKL